MKRRNEEEQEKNAIICCDLLINLSNNFFSSVFFVRLYSLINYSIPFFLFSSNNMVHSTYMDTDNNNQTLCIIHPWISTKQKIILFMLTPQLGVVHILSLSSPAPYRAFNNYTNNSCLKKKNQCLCAHKFYRTFSYEIRKQYVHMFTCGPHHSQINSIFLHSNLSGI